MTITGLDEVFYPHDVLSIILNEYPASTNTITVEYEGKTATFDVEIIEKTNEEYVLGDINKDNKITVTDLILLKRHLIADTKEEWKLSNEQQSIADVNEDGIISITDLVLLKRIVLKND